MREKVLNGIPKRGMNRRVRVLMSMTLVSSLVLGACKQSHEQEYLDQYNEVSAEYQVLYDQYRDLKDIVSVYTGETDSDYVYKIKESDGDITKYHSYNGTVMMSNDIQLPGATAVKENQASVTLFSDITITPSDKWVVRPSTNETELIYDDGIYGTIELVEFFPTNVDWDVYFAYDDVIKPYFDTVGITNATDGLVYYSGNVAGRYGVGYLNTVSNSTEMKTDEEIWEEVKAKINTDKISGKEVSVDTNGEIPSNLKELATQYDVSTVKSGEEDGKSVVWVGLIRIGTTAIKFRFTYKDNDTSTSFNEVIKSLMGTLKVYGNPMTLN